MELLAERGLGFSFCLNKDELVVLSGLGLLHQSLDLDANSKLYKDTQKMIAAASTVLEQTKSPCATEFCKVARTFSPLNASAPVTKPLSMSRHNSDGNLPPPNFLNLSQPEQNKLAKAAQRLGVPFDGKDQRRATFPTISLHQQVLQAQSQHNIAPAPQPAQISRSEPADSPSNLTRPASMAGQSTVSIPKRRTHLDYFSFSNAPTRSHSPDHTSSENHSIPHIKAEHTEWEHLLGSIDGSHTNIFDNIYGGPAVEYHGGKQEISPPNPHIAHSTASTDSLAWSSPADLQWALNGTDTLHPGGYNDYNPHPESVFSLSTDDGSANNGDDLFSAGNDWGSASSTHSTEAYAGIVMPGMDSGDEGILGGVWETAAVI